MNSKLDSLCSLCCSKIDWLINQAVELSFQIGLSEGLSNSS